MIKVQSYEKGMKLRKRYEVTKKIRSYEKGTKLEKGTKIRTWYEAMKKIRRYEKCKKMLRNKLRKALIMKLPSYEIVSG